MTADEFVTAFYELCDETSIFVPGDRTYPANTNCYFSLELTDEVPMLRGLGVVIDSWSSAESPFHRPGAHVRITQLTAQSELIFDRLLAARPAALRSGPRTRNAPMTQQQWGAVIEAPTEEMEAVFPLEDEEPAAPNAEENVPSRPITRELRSSTPPATTPATASGASTRNKPASLSAAPIAELDERTTGTARYEAQVRLPASGPASAAARSQARASSVVESNAISGTWDSFAMPSPASQYAVDGDDASVDLRPRSWWRGAWWANPRIAGVFVVGILVGVLFGVVFRPSADISTVAAAIPAQPLVSCPTTVASSDPLLTNRAAPTIDPPKPSTEHVVGAPAKAVATTKSVAVASVKAVAVAPAKPVAPTPTPTKSTTPATGTSTVALTASTSKPSAIKAAAPVTKSVASSTSKPSSGKVTAKSAASKPGKRVCSSLDCI